MKKLLVHVAHALVGALATAAILALVVLVLTGLGYGSALLGIEGGQESPWPAFQLALDGLILLWMIALALACLVVLIAWGVIPLMKFGSFVCARLHLRRDS